MRHLIFLSLLLFSQISYAEEARPPWLQPDTLKAAVAIGLTEEQKPHFRAAVTDLINNQISATNKLIRRNNVSNLERKLKTATNRQFKKMDKSMQRFLTEEQYPQYLTYRQVLKSHLTKGAVNRSGSSDDANSVANSALNGFSDSN